MSRGCSLLVQIKIAVLILLSCADTDFIKRTWHLITEFKALMTTNGNSEKVQTSKKLGRYPRESNLDATKKEMSST